MIPAATAHAPPAAAAFSKTTAAHVRALISSTLAAERIAGATVVVAVGGNVVDEASAGLADLAAKKPARPDTIYPIGSITKQFTAACILLLAQKGALSIDDPVSRYVPALPWGDRVTLRHLLDQESGIVDFRAGSLDDTTALAPADVVGRLKLTDLLFPPGSKYEYSDSNYYLLGLVVENASGMSYAEFLRRRIFEPLGLRSTTYGAPADASRLAKPYVVSGSALREATPESPDWSYAAGAIDSTARDLAAWDAALWEGKLLDAGSVREMTTPGVLDDGTATDYAFGWVAVEHDRQREIWHNGEIVGYHAMNAYYPDDKTAIMVLTNTGGTYAADRLAVQIFDAVHPFAPTAADAAATGRAREWIGRLVRGDVDRTQLGDALNAALTDPVVKSAGDQLRSFGPLRSVVLDSVDRDASGRSFALTVVFAKKTVRWVMGIDTNGKLSALYFHL